MSKKSFRPTSVSLFLAVEFVDYQKSSKRQLPTAIKVAAKRFHTPQWLVKRFHNHKTKNSEQWIFFKTNAGHLAYIYNNRDTLRVHEKIWIVDYRDFFIFRYTGEVFRKDGFGICEDVSGRRFIKDFQGTMHLPEKIIYAGAKDPRYTLSYERMRTMKVQFKDGNKNNLKVSNLFAKNDKWQEV